MRPSSNNKKHKELRENIIVHIGSTLRKATRVNITL